MSGFAFFPPQFVLVNSSGRPYAGAVARFFAAGTSTGLTVYTDASLATPHGTSVTANSAGVFPPVFIDPEGGNYKVSFFTSAGSLIRTVDDLPATYPLTANQVGAAIYPRTAAETAASVTPTNYGYKPGDVRRYGAVGDGTTDDTLAFSRALLVASDVYVPTPSVRYRLTDEVTVPANGQVRGDGASSIIRQETRNKNVFILSAGSQVMDLALEGDNATSTGATATKNNGVYASGVARVRVVRCHFSRFQGAGVQLRDCTDYLVAHNICRQNPYSAQANGSLNGDIVVYSLTAGARGVIAHNHCLSNNDFGIYYGANGADLDTVITGNVCVATDGTSEVASGGSRRHGIIATYGGSAGGRTIVANNIVRNSTMTGIVRQGASTPTGTHIFANNHISATGFLNDSLCGGIFLNVGASGDKIVGNVVENFRGSSNLANAGIVVNNSKPGVEVVGNTIKDSQGHGVLVIGTTSDCILRNNVYRNNALADLVVQHTGQDAEGGGHSIDGEHFTKLVATKPCVRIVADNDTAARPIKVRNCQARGVDKTTTGSGEAAFVTIEGSTVTPVVIEGNEADTFYYGVYSFANIPSGRTFAQLKIDRNVFREMNTAIFLQRGSTADTVVACDNTFIGVATQISAGYIGNRVGDKFLLTTTTAAPSDGTWAVGDQALNASAAVGAARGWVCTTAGNPGTWTSRGNL
jgi:hypothetical protein